MKNLVILFAFVQIGFIPAARPLLAGQSSDLGGGRPNVLLLTADDLGYGSLGVTGCTIQDITPHLDQLAAQGLRFERAYVTVAVCQPCRQVLMTGRYPHCFGALGFEPIDESVLTLGQSLQAAGYFKGILGKDEHLQPQHKFCWDVVLPTTYARNGRDARVFYRHACRFFRDAKRTGKPFFLMADAVDPHRPFPDTAQEKRAESAWGTRHPPARALYPPEDVPVPGFLPDLPEVRQELAAYYAAVHRCDEVIGAVLRALGESGFAENTLVMFLSDHGMAFPFGKSNCYRHSTRTPWIVRWPGKVKPRTVDREHFISGVDFFPTILDALGLPMAEGLDGRSFLPVLIGDRQAGRRQVFTAYNRSPGNRDYPMRCLENERFAYIFNAWSNGEVRYVNSAGGQTLSAMKRAAKTNPAIAARVHMFEYRVAEEFYDYHADPYALKNLASDPRFRADMRRMRAELMHLMREHQDPLLPAMQMHLEGRAGEIPMEMRFQPESPIETPYTTQKWKGELPQPVRQRDLAHVRSLGFTRQAITEADLMSVERLTQLEFLNLARTNVTDAAMFHLKGLVNLEMLYLYETAISDDGLKHLAGLTRLKWLNLTGTRISDAGLAYLKRMKSLQIVYLNDTNISDAGLAHLRGLTNLDVLQIDGTQVTEQGIARLQKWLPATSIYSRYE